MTALITVCAKYLFVTIALFFGYVFWKCDAEQRRLLILRGVLVVAVAFVLAKAAGALYFEPRPFVVQHVMPLVAHEADNGFPSDHTLLVFSCAFLLLPFNRSAAIGAMVVGAAVGTARIAALIHSPLDIAASILFAAIANGIAALVIKQPAAVKEKAPN